MTRILVIDSYNDSRRMTETLLRERGYAVQGSSDPQEALELMEHFQPDLVLVEWFLASDAWHQAGRERYEVCPNSYTLVKRGVSMLEAIRRLQPELPVLVWTVWPDLEAEEQQRVQVVGVGGVLRKPLTLENVFQHIDRCVRHSLIERLRRHSATPHARLTGAFA